MDTNLTILLVIIVLALLPLSRLFVLIKRKMEIAKDEIIRMIQLSGDKVKIPPERGSFRGATNKLGRIKSDGIIALTDKKLIFQKALSAVFEIDLADVVEITTDAKFLGAWRAGATHLILNLINDERVGFYVADLEKWKNELSSLLKK